MRRIVVAVLLAALAGPACAGRQRSEEPRRSQAREGMREANEEVEEGLDEAREGLREANDEVEDGLEKARRKWRDWLD